MTAGMKTSEFWLGVAVFVAATVLLVTHHIDATVWSAITGVSVGAYSLSRGIAKTGGS